MEKLSINKISYSLGINEIDVTSFTNSYPDWDIKKVISKTGIFKIHKVGEKETAIDLAVNVLDKFCKEYNIDKTDIDGIILVTQTPDYLLPTSACILQDKAGLRNDILAFDINLGCSGFVNSLSIATSLINNNVIKNCALICSETYSKHIKLSNRSCSPIFSDAASMTLVEKKGISNIGPFNFGVDGSGFDNLIVKGSGARDLYNKKQELYMNGPEILMFTLGHLPKLIDNFLIKNKISFDEIDLFFFHQASKTVLDALKSKLNIPEDKFIYDLGNIGNTVSSSIPISLKLALKKNRLKSGDKILLIGFGVGYSSGIAFIEW